MKLFLLANTLTFACISNTLLAHTDPPEQTEDQKKESQRILSTIIPKIDYENCRLELICQHLFKKYQTHKSFKGAEVQIQEALKHPLQRIPRLELHNSTFKEILGLTLYQHPKSVGYYTQGKRFNIEFGYSGLHFYKIEQVQKGGDDIPKGLKLHYKALTNRKIDTQAFTGADNFYTGIERLKKLSKKEKEWHGQNIVVITPMKTAYWSPPNENEWQTYEARTPLKELKFKVPKNGKHTPFEILTHAAKHAKLRLTFTDNALLLIPNPNAK